jgi:hypothetical protein
MRLRRTLVTVLATAVLVPSVAMAAHVTVTLFPPPPGELAVEDLWKARVTSDTVADAWFEGFMFEASGRQVFWARSRPFRLAVGTRTYRYRDVTVEKSQAAPGYEVLITRTGQLPAGTYRFKLIIQPFGAEDSGTLVFEPTGPPRLISPRDRDTVFGPYPLFVWARPAPAPSGLVTYELRVCEILPGQRAPEALRANRPWYQQSRLAGTSHRYPNSARALEHGRHYAWEVIAELGRGARSAPSEPRSFAKRRTRLGIGGGQVGVLVPLKIQREVTRFGNWYRVKLTLSNIGAQTLTDITLTDSHRYFQCIEDARRRRLPPPGGEQVPGWTTDWENAVSHVRIIGGGFSNAFHVSLGSWTLPPGLSMTVTYSVLPLLTVSPTGPGHAIGVGLKATYRIGENQYAREYNGQAVYPVTDLTQAWKSADYLITTCPSRLQGPQQDVIALLVAMARLAKTREGALLYFTNAPTTAATCRAAFKAFGTVLKNTWQNGYLLIVGEEDVLPHRPDFTDSYVDGVKLTQTKTLTRSDYYYSDLSGDRRPEVAVGRIIGRDAYELRLPIEVSLSVAAHEAESDGSHTMMISGHEKIGDMFPVVAESGAAYLRRTKATTVACWHGEYYTTAARTMHKAIIHAPWPSVPPPRGADPCCQYCSPRPCGCGCTCLNQFWDRQLATWVLQEEMGMPAFNAQYPPKSTDETFVDVNGRTRRVPLASASALIAAGAGAAAQIEFARGGYFGASYLFLPNDSTAGSLFVSRLRSNLAGKDFVVYNGHSGAAGWYGVNNNMLMGAGLMASKTRPVAACFGCSGGDYPGHASSISRAFLRLGAGAYIGATQMINTADANRQVKERRFLKHWAKRKRIGDVHRDWKYDMALNTVATNGLDLRLLHVMNLYGDPKFGGD